MLYIYDSRYEEALDDHIRAIAAVSELRKRGVTLKLIKNNDLNILHGNGEDVLLIPFSFNKDMHDMLINCNKKGVPVITLHNYPDYFWDCYYSTIERDTKKCIRMLLAYIMYITNEKPKIAYFGTTPTAYSDRVKINTLYAIYDEMNQSDIYFNNSCFKDCFEKFYENRKRYDAVICANSYIAVAFIKCMRERDPECLNRLKIVSFLETKISRLYYTSVSIAAYDEESIYDSVIWAYKKLGKNSLITFINIELDNKIIIRESSGGALPDNNLFFSPTPSFESPRLMNYPEQSEAFTEYVKDPLLKNIVFIERLLTQADIIDLNIILMFLEGYKNADIAVKLLISVQTVHYRSQNMFRIMSADNKKNFINILSEYIDLEKLKEYVKENET